MFIYVYVHKCMHKYTCTMRTSVRSGYFKLSLRNEPKGRKSFSADIYCASCCIWEAWHVLRRWSGNKNAWTLTGASHALWSAFRENAGSIKRALHSQWIWFLWRQKQLKTLRLSFSGRPTPFAGKIQEALSLILSDATRTQPSFEGMWPLV